MNIQAIRNATTIRAVLEARALCQPRDWAESISLDEAAKRREYEILEARDRLALCLSAWLLLGVLVLFRPM